MRWILLGLLSLALPAVAAARPFMVVVYNVENLVDADGRTHFDDYRPPHYTPAHALTKLQNIARVVARFEGGRGPDILLLQEIETDFTPSAARPDYDAILRRYADLTIEDMLGPRFDAAIADLPAEALLAKAFADRGLAGYRIVAADVLAAPGTRPLAQKCVVFTRFPVLAARVHPTTDARAVLEVKVDVDGAPLYLFDNHWKAGADDPAAERIRLANARTLRTRLDEILAADPHADVIIGGDFNSEYSQNRRHRRTMPETGLNDVLGSQGNELSVRGPKTLYNLWYELPAAERGSDWYRGAWGTLMQLMITRGLYDYRGVQYVDDSFGVARLAGLNMDAQGRPLRWSFDGPAGAGFSDHFPLYAKFVTVRDNRPDEYLPLRDASVEPAESASDASGDTAPPDLSKAVTSAQVPAGVSIRSAEYQGRIFRVEGRVGRGRKLTVQFRGESYEIWSFDAALRDRLRRQYPAGATIRFYGELGRFKERWQFVIHDESWVK